MTLNESALYLGSALVTSLSVLSLALQMPVVVGVVALLEMVVQAWLLTQARAPGVACLDS